MSLFGDEDVPARAKQSSSLFDDDAKPSGKTGSGLFSDEMDGNDSPWGLPTPKKADRGALIKSLLPASEVPDAYIDAFDALLEAGEGAGNGVSWEGAKKLLERSGVPSESQAKIVEIVLQPGQERAGLTRGEFNVLFALLGLAQDGDDVILDSVDERKKSECARRAQSMCVVLTLARPPRALCVAPSVCEAAARTDAADPGHAAAYTPRAAHGGPVACTTEAGVWRCRGRSMGQPGPAQRPRPRRLRGATTVQRRRRGTPRHAHNQPVHDALDVRIGHGPRRHPAELLGQRRRLGRLQWVQPAFRNPRPGRRRLRCRARWRWVRSS